MTRNEVLVAPAREDDYEWCARLMASSEPWITLGRGSAECLTRCSHPEYLLLVARKGDQRAGFCLLHPRGLAGSPYVASIAVAPVLRSRGIGAGLLKRAELQFPAARNMFLCVSSFNVRARRFYERSGYSAIGELTDYVTDGVSEILMRKRLART